MTVTRKQKQEIIEKLVKIFQESKSLAFVNFHKLTVANAVTLRRALRAAGVGYLVAKKTLLKKAIYQSKIDGEPPKLEGEIALAYSKDDVAPMREISSFAKKIGVGLELVGGFFGGRFVSKSEAKEIAMIPDIATLRGQFVNVINSPIQGLVMVLNAYAKKKGE